MRRRLAAAGLAVLLAGAVAGCFGGPRLGPPRSDYYVVSFEPGTATPTADGRRSLEIAASAARGAAAIILSTDSNAAASARLAVLRTALAAERVPPDRISDEASLGPALDTATIQLRFGGIAK